MNKKQEAAAFRAALLFSLLLGSCSSDDDLFRLSVDDVNFDGKQVPARIQLSDPQILPARRWSTTAGGKPCTSRP